MNSTKKYIHINKPANKCNQFIIVHLIKMRNISQKIRNDRKFVIYNSAIQSIKKYPLPIICTTQLKLLNGIGQYLCDQLIKIIKNHYKNFLNSHANRSQNFQSLEKQRSLISINQENQQNDQLDSQANDLLQNNQEKSMKSVIVARTYKPRLNSQAGFLLIGLSKLSCINKYWSKDEILEILNRQGLLEKSNIKSWNSTQQMLLTHGYIVLSSTNTNEIMLTQKGRQYSITLLEKKIFIQSKNKILNDVSEFKSQHLSKIEQSQQHSHKQFSIHRREISYFQGQLTLIIDSRQVKDQNDRNYFQEKLTQKYGICCQVSPISIGDFLWVFNGQVLDYIIQRKKADDLASSIMDGRYKQQKFRLKASGITNIFYLFEGHPSTNSCKNQKQLQNALLKTRIKDNFKIVKTNNINQSLRFIAFLHQELLQKITNKKKICTVGLLDDFNIKNGKCSGLTVQLIFGLGIKCFPGVGKNTVSQLLKYFKSFKILYDKLSEFNSKSQKIQFLKQLLKGGRTPSNFPENLVDFLFNKSYQ